MSFKLDYSEFNETLEEYRRVHKKRTLPEIVNKKALFIARGAIRQTPRPEPTVIGRALSKIIYTFKGARKTLTQRVTGSGKSFAPVAALLINFRRGKRGKPGLFGADMKAAIKSLIARSASARAFLASGWIPAVKRLTPLVRSRKGMPPDDSEAKQIKNPKGSVKPANVSGDICVATIVNQALSKFTTTGKNEVFDKAAQALQKAIDKERASMEQDIENQMRDDAKSCGIKTN